MFRHWYKYQGFLVAFYCPAVYCQFLDLQQYGWTSPAQIHCITALWLNIFVCKRLVSMFILSDDLFIFIVEIPGA